MSLGLAFFNGLNAYLPYRGFFGWRRWWLRRCGLTVGRGVRIAAGARFYDHWITIGAGAWIGPETSVVSCSNGPINIGALVDLAPGVMVVSGTHLADNPARRAGTGTGAPITIGEGTWVGVRSVILGGAQIGTQCIVAAGAIVTPGPYPDNVLLAGVPAKVKNPLP